MILAIKNIELEGLANLVGDLQTLLAFCGQNVDLKLNLEEVLSMPYFVGSRCADSARRRQGNGNRLVLPRPKYRRR